jgi:murein DD-endopeptidase MepM/ murein hydrolase activator NlpD
VTRSRTTLLLLALVGVASVATGEPAPNASEPAQNPPELALVQADSSEEETVQRLQLISTEKERLLRRSEIQGRAYVRLVKLGLLPLSDGFSSFVSHAGRVEALRRTLARDLLRVAELDAEATASRNALREVRTRREALVRRATDYQRTRDAIVAAKEREAAYQRAFASGGSASRHTAVYVSNNEADGVASFAELKGRLPFPVEGRAEVRELEPSGTHGPRVSMLMELGTVARSVFKGRVVLVGDHDAGTRVVIIDHGSGYSTLQGNLTRVMVRVGDQVAAGAEVGELASDASGRSRLEFEVRHDGRNLLPTEWFGI